MIENNYYHSHYRKLTVTSIGRTCDYYVSSIDRYAEIYIYIYMFALVQKPPSSCFVTRGAPTYLTSV